MGSVKRRLVARYGDGTKMGQMMMMGQRPNT